MLLVPGAPITPVFKYKDVQVYQVWEQGITIIKGNYYKNHSHMSYAYMDENNFTHLHSTIEAVKADLDGRWEEYCGWTVIDGEMYFEGIKLKTSSK